MCESWNAARRRTLAAIAAYVVSLMLALPYAMRPGPHVPGIVAMFSIGIFVTELATGALLLAAFDAEHRWSFLLLGGSYLFSALMAVVHLLTFNGALLPGGAVVPMTANGSGWVFISWVVVFALVCLAAVIAELTQRASTERRSRTGIAIVLVAAFAIAFAALIVGVAARFGDAWLPPLVTADGRWTALNAQATMLAVAANVVSIVGALCTRRNRDAVFLWLALALTAIACANVIALASGGRFSTGWIVGRMSWLFAASVLFVYFLVQHASQSRKLKRLNDMLSDEIQQSTGRLHASEARLAAIVSTTSEAILSKSLDGKIASWNEGATRLLKYKPDEIVGRSIRELIPQSRQGDEDEVLARIAAGERVDNYETLRIDRDGALVEVSMTVSPLIVHGKLVGASSVMHDISVRKERERHTNLLLREINHRSKNLLAVVQAMARQTVVHSPSAFLKSFNERLHALAASQDLLVKSHWRGVDLGDLVRIELNQYRELIGTRVVVSGPALVITAAAAQNLGLALHELATNAGKFGPLSGNFGHVGIAWSVQRDEAKGRLVMQWIESGGPPVVPPRKTGFGTTLTTDILRTALNGTVHLDYKPGGLEWRLEAPLASIAETENVT